VKIDEGQQKNKNRPHQPTIKFSGFLPINFLPPLAPPYSLTDLPPKKILTHPISFVLFLWKWKTKEQQNWQMSIQFYPQVS